MSQWVTLSLWGARRNLVKTISCCWDSDMFGCWYSETTGLPCVFHKTSTGPDDDDDDDDDMQYYYQSFYTATPGFLQVRENWEKSGNLSGQAKFGGKYFIWKSQGKWKIDITRCQIFRLKYVKFDFRWGSAPDPLGSLQCSPRLPSCT